MRFLWVLVCPMQGGAGAMGVAFWIFTQAAGAEHSALGLSVVGATGDWRTAGFVVMGWCTASPCAGPGALLFALKSLARWFLNQTCRERTDARAV